LINNVFYNTTSTARNSDLQTVMSKMTNNQLVLQTITDNQNLVVNNLQDQIEAIKNVDQTTAAALAINAQNTLSASYSVLNNVLNMSLLNYLSSGAV